MESWHWLLPESLLRLSVSGIRTRRRSSFRAAPRENKARQGLNPASRHLPAAPDCCVGHVQGKGIGLRVKGGVSKNSKMYFETTADIKRTWIPFYFIRSSNKYLLRSCNVLSIVTGTEQGLSKRGRCQGLKGDKGWRCVSQHLCICRVHSPPIVSLTSVAGWPTWRPSAQSLA